MPRRNKRKHYKGEGTLGFDPNKYISRPGNGGGYYRYRDPVKLAQRVSCERKGYDCHKAHSDNARKRRAMDEIRQMQRSAERICRESSFKTHTSASSVAVSSAAYDLEPLVVQKAQAILEALPVQKPQGPATDQNKECCRGKASGSAKHKSIIGGIVTWLKRKLPPA